MNESYTGAANGIKFQITKSMWTIHHGSTDSHDNKTHDNKLTFEVIYVNLCSALCRYITPTWKDQQLILNDLKAFFYCIAKQQIF